MAWENFMMFIRKQNVLNLIFMEMCSWKITK